MPLDVLEVFVLYWIATCGFMVWIIKSNIDLKRRLEEGEEKT